MGVLTFFNALKSTLYRISETVGKIIIPDAVSLECTKDKSKPGAKEIMYQIKMGNIEVHPIIKPDAHAALFHLLGEGEASAIVLALAKNESILIDDKLGRKTAKELKLSVIGTAGILMLAKKKKLVTKIKPIILTLQESGYYLSNHLIAELLTTVNEK